MCHGKICLAMSPCKTRLTAMFFKWLWRMQQKYRLAHLADPNRVEFLASFAYSFFEFVKFFWNLLGALLISNHLAAAPRLKLPPTTTLLYFPAKETQIRTPCCSLKPDKNTWNRLSSPSSPPLLLGGLLLGHLQRAAEWGDRRGLPSWRATVGDHRGCTTLGWNGTVRGGGGGGKLVGSLGLFEEGVFLFVVVFFLN